MTTAILRSCDQWKKLQTPPHWQALKGRRSRSPTLSNSWGLITTVGPVWGTPRTFVLVRRTKTATSVIVADLFIKDRSLIEAIERGVRDISCGHVYDLIQLSNGDWAQVNLRVNHIAVVPEGRSGTSKIMDSKDGDEVDGQKIDRLCGLLEKLLEQRGASESKKRKMPSAAVTPRKANLIRRTAPVIRRKTVSKNWAPLAEDESAEEAEGRVRACCRSAAQAEGLHHLDSHRRIRKGRFR